jgi:hypothetical protein
MCRVFADHTLIEINPAPGAEPMTLDLRDDPGRTVEITVVDPEGQPVEDVAVSGLSRLNRVSFQERSKFKAKAVDPRRPHRLAVFHHQRKLVGST